MRCCCDEINRCQRDIGTIGEIQSTLQNAASTGNEIGAAMGAISAAIAAAASPSNAGELSELMQNFNRSMTLDITVMISECGSMRSQLQNELTYLRSSDEAYHEWIASQYRVEKI